MAQIKLPKLPDRTPIKLTISVSPDLDLALRDYAAAYEVQYGVSESLAHLIPAMLQDYLAADRGFGRRRKDQQGN